MICVHHIQWVRELPDGLHQCIQCGQAVAAKDVYPKLEELPDDFRRRWEAHEATRSRPAAPTAAPAASGAAPDDRAAPPSSPAPRR